MVETWLTAFAKQAKSDWDVFRALGTFRFCHQLHYLQMATEKLAKAFLCVLDGQRPEGRHGAFVRFIQHSKLHRQVQGKYSMSRDQFRAFIDGLLPTAKLIEELAPAGDRDKPNPEYPWEHGGAVISPLTYSFATLQLGTPKMTKLLQFVGVCLDLLP
ncbi:MAG: hypothetical protein PHU85_13775 [Phycisphaerae bacterium]|nr:hypothetical protein [Phycisphaerae bacterium]